MDGAESLVAQDARRGGPFKFTRSEGSRRPDERRVRASPRHRTVPKPSPDENTSPGTFLGTKKSAVARQEATALGWVKPLIQPQILISDPQFGFRPLAANISDKRLLAFPKGVAVALNWWSPN